MKGNIYKLVSLILIILMMFVSAACGAAAPTEPEETPSVTQPTVQHTVITLGSYEQDGDTTSAEPIEWIVIAGENGKKLLISKYILDCQMFNEVYGECTYDSSSIRKWLNDDFLTKAFTEEEQAKLLVTTVMAEADSTGSDVEDKVFLLSESEVKAYLVSDELKLAKATAFAENAGVMVNGNGIGAWWLSSMGTGFRAALYVNEKGEIPADGRGVDYVLYGVRPAIWISAE